MDNSIWFEEFKNTGITALFNPEKAAQVVKEKFESQGRLGELEQHIRNLSEMAIHQLEEPVSIPTSGEIEFKQHLFYELLKSEGITLDADYFLRLGGERIAFVDEGIIPLKGKRQELKKVLEKIVEKRKELGYSYEGPFTYALANINKLEAYDPREELKQKQFEDEYREAELELKLLEEMPYVKVQEMKRFGIIPKKTVELNPGYEEFFHNHLCNYSKNEIYFALKKLEKILSGGNKEKIGALRKQFEKKEGICRSKKLALGLAGIVAAGVIGYGIYQYFKPNLKEKFLSFAVSNNITQGDADNFYSEYIDLVNSLYPKNSSSLLPPLDLYSKNSTVFEKLYRNISIDPQITIDRDELLSLASQLFLDLGYTGKVKVLVPGTDNYTEEFLADNTIQAFGNYSVALNQLGLPKHDRDVLFLLGNASQINPETVDFEPIIIKDVDGNIFVIQSRNIARDHWMIGEHLKHTPYVVKYPEMFEGFNVKVQQNAWDILDNPHGPGYYDNVTYHADDKVIWDKVIMPQWRYYWNSTPQARNVSKRITVFPWYDSSLLKDWVPDKTNRHIALIYLWELPARTFDKANNQVLSGIDGMKSFVEQLPNEYEKIVNLYQNPEAKENTYAKICYYGWLIDRGRHGLSNIVSQYIGDWKTFEERWNEAFGLYDWRTQPHELLKYVEAVTKGLKSVDQFLMKNWEPCDLIKFLYGYERNHSAEYGSEADMYNFGLPLAYKAFGVPHGEIRIKPLPIGAMAWEDGIVIPDKQIQDLKRSSAGEIVLEHGNLLSLYGCINGLEKDGITEVTQKVRDIWTIYLWRKS